ncbi:MAG: hypothetical protein RAK22_03140 [Nanoarchaeota archaeon]|nr:hypothetical protein [Nanoarchaeota archaeon]
MLEPTVVVLGQSSVTSITAGTVRGFIWPVTIALPVPNKGSSAATCSESPPAADKTYRVSPW